jgi:hypothetical protein
MELTTPPHKNKLLQDLKMQQPDGLFKTERETIKGFENWIMECTTPIPKLRCGDSMDQDIMLLREKN